MPIDPNIIMGIKPVQIANPLEQYMQVQQIQGAQNQSRLQDLMYGEKQRDLAADKVQADAMTNGDDIVAALARAGYGSRALAYRRTKLDADAKQAEIDKTKGETDKMAREAAEHQFEIAGQLAAAWAQNPNVNQTSIRAGLASALHSKIISEDVYKAKIGELDAIPDNPGTLNDWAKGTLQQVMKAKDSYGYMAPDANTVANNATSRANNAATVAATRRGQDLTDARAREQNALAREGQQTQVVVDPNQGVLLVNKGTKTAIPAKFADGTVVPSANAVAAGKLNDQLKAGITEARRLIPLATASGAGAMLDKGAAFFGKSTEGADAAAQLDTLVGWMTANVPRMQGPQSDKDVLLYRQMAGDVANRSLPASRRLAALDSLEKLKNKYADINQGGTPAKANTNAAPAMNSKGWKLHVDANGNKAYMSPDGKSWEEVK